MTIEFEKFQPNKVLPGQILDFVLRDPKNGITSPEFVTAVNKGDAANIIEGIYSIIMNAETRFKITLSDADKFRIQMIAQDEVVREVLTRAEKKVGFTNMEEKTGKLRQLCEHISKTNKTINSVFAKVMGENCYV